MRKILLIPINLLILQFFIAQSAICQSEVVEVYEVVESMPRFPGCEDLQGTNEIETEKLRNQCSREKLDDYIRSKVNYFGSAKGEVIASFVVRTDGKITDTKILSYESGLPRSYVIDAIISMNRMDEKWIIGTDNGKPVNATYTVSYFLERTLEEDAETIVEEAPLNQGKKPIVKSTQTAKPKRKEKPALLDREYRIPGTKFMVDLPKEFTGYEAEGYKSITYDSIGNYISFEKNYTTISKERWEQMRAKKSEDGHYLDVELDSLLLPDDIDAFMFELPQLANYKMNKDKVVYLKFGNEHNSVIIKTSFVTSDPVYQERIYAVLSSIRYDKTVQLPAWEIPSQRK